MAQEAQQELLQQLRLEPQHRPLRTGSRWSRIATLLAGLVVLAGVLLTYALLRSNPVGTQAAAAASATRAPSAAATSSVPAGAAALQASGYVPARREATVSAQITGALVSVPIQEGEHVVKGQVLARLDDSAQQASVAQARAQLMAAKALLVQYQAQLKEARLQNHRNAVLIREDSIAQQTYDQLQAQVAELEATVASQSDQIRLARATLQAAQVQLDYTVVRAPYAGIIVEKTPKSARSSRRCRPAEDSSEPASQRSST